MITTVSQQGIFEFRGKSSDQKPVNDTKSLIKKIRNGSSFFEFDTGDVYMFDEEENSWLKI